MKWNLSNSIIALISTSLLCLSNPSFASASSLDDLVSISQTFREPKKIGFAGALGGSSHFNWVLSIMNELSDRGHNMTFFAKDDFTRFGKPYPSINTVSIGAPYKYDRAGILDNPKIRDSMLKMMPKIITLLSDTMEQDYTTMTDFINLYELDVILCDHFFEPCINAAKAAKIPFIVTACAEMTKDSAAPYINNDLLTMSEPTTENQSIWKRFNNKFILPLRVLQTLWPTIQKTNKIRKELGITSSGDPTTDWQDSLKLINNRLGLMPARPLGSLIETVGPIMPARYQPLRQDLKDYFDQHQRLAYVAFGQNASPIKQDITLILTALMESIESGDIDGFLWATVHAEGRFPDYIQTASNTTYSTLDMFENKYSNIRMVKWAPQTAILFHPSTYIFVSHGGLGSWVESLYAGKRMVMFPFFSDQPGNAIMNERAKVGGILKRDYTPLEAAALFKKIIKDEHGEIEKGVKRFQALVQIHSNHGVLKGADAVEEVAFLHVDGKIPHRYPASRNMNYFKANNIDIYALLVLIILVSSSTLIYASTMIYKTVDFTKLSPSQKKLKSV